MKSYYIDFISKRSHQARVTAPDLESAKEAFLDLAYGDDKEQFLNDTFEADEEPYYQYSVEGKVSCYDSYAVQDYRDGEFYFFDNWTDAEEFATKIGRHKTGIEHGLVDIDSKEAVISCAWVEGTPVELGGGHGKVILTALLDFINKCGDAYSVEKADAIIAYNRVLLDVFGEEMRPDCLKPIWKPSH